MTARVRGVSARSTARGIQAQRVGLDVHQHGPGADVLDDVHAGHERVGRGDHLVARAHAQRGQREVQAAGGRVERRCRGAPRPGRRCARPAPAPLGPVVIQPDSSASSTSCFSRAPIEGREKGRNAARTGVPPREARVPGEALTGGGRGRGRMRWHRDGDSRARRVRHPTGPAGGAMTTRRLVGDTLGLAASQYAARAVLLARGVVAAVALGPGGLRRVERAQPDPRLRRVRLGRRAAGARPAPARAHGAGRGARRRGACSPAPGASCSPAAACSRCSWSPTLATGHPALLRGLGWARRCSCWPRPCCSSRSSTTARRCARAGASAR